MRKFKDYLMVSLKGACMGAADVIPGVSGGTIAFIMGIYDEFVGSIAKVDKNAVKMLFKGRFRELWKHINGGFLLSLVVGIGVSVVCLAGAMQKLLNDFPIQTWAFFFGLIVASSIFILKGISGWKGSDAVWLAVGIMLGIVVCTMSPTQTPDALWFIFLSGAIAVCAMILPGISGSFILLILGKYQYIMEAISGFTSGAAIGESLVILSVFAVGAVCGLLSFSKFLHWLLGRFNKETLLVLSGFIIGSLVKVWPWSNMEAIINAQFPEVAILGQAVEEEIMSGFPHHASEQIYHMALARKVEMVDFQIPGAILFALLGFSLVTGIELVGKHMSSRKQKDQE